ncbi:MAG TPA: valine--tRNA ligase [bacterium]|nr:valine--tRNA ligase [bacterium]
MTKKLDQFFDHQKAEERWYRFWEEKGYFRPAQKADAKNYCIVIPPPNVTGILHEGHALNNTLQDILIRYHRMLGENVLWQPGTDHAGISTQYMVEKELAAENKTKEEIGREEFLKRVWKWKEQKGGHIINQLKRLGASCDWTRERFTMDEGLSRAVRETFVKLYDEGLIYRGEYMVNWCPRCDTALSNLEVVMPDVSEAEKGLLYYVSYPLAAGSGKLTVATTRPETMLGDTAVAVNPEDERYKSFIGKKVRLPLTDHEIPVIGEPYVDMEFGTGALKITPGHDFNDYEIGKKHGLAAPQAIDRRARMTDYVPEKYRGLDRFEARETVVRDLKAQGLLEKTEPYNLLAGRCYRCKTVVEPVISEQWFVKIEPLARPALQAVRDGKSIIIPEAQEKEYYNWMENLRDWCISRQLWWGHQIPAWHCDECRQITVSRDDPEKCAHCGQSNIRRDPDVLDTWFSSALWPFSTLGWPDQTPELERFYPNSAMITGFDILKFWVARMMMMGIHLLGQVPFTDIYLHGLVRDELGRKKSKTLGNFVDPIEIIEEFGADALRFTLTYETYTGRDIRLGESRITDTKKFINKIWNAARFTLGNLEEFDPASGPAPEFSAADKWITSRLQKAITAVRGHADHYRFHEMADAVYHFIWDELCDWYIEWSKPSLYNPQSPGEKRAAQETLISTLTAAVKLLHPIMPFFSEEVYQSLPGATESIMVSEFPARDEEKEDADLEANMALVQSIVVAIRNTRSENLVPAGARTKITLTPDTAPAADVLHALQGYILSPPQVQIAELVIAEPGAPVSKKAVTRRCGPVQVSVHVAGLVNPDQEIKRIDKELAKLGAELKKVEAKLANQGFIAKAPPEVIAKQKEIQEELTAKKATLLETRKRMEDLKQQSGIVWKA